MSSRFPDRIDNIQCNVDGSRVNDFHSIGVRGLLPGDQATYDVSLPCPYLHTRTAGEFEVMINADPAGSIIESNEDNNTSRSDTALLPHRVVPGSGGLRGGDTF